MKKESIATGFVSTAGKSIQRKKQDSVASVALAAISAIAAAHDGTISMIAITLIVVTVAIVEYRR